MSALFFQRPDKRLERKRGRQFLRHNRARCAYGQHLGQQVPDAEFKDIPGDPWCDVVQKQAFAVPAISPGGNENAFTIVERPGGRALLPCDGRDVRPQKLEPLESGIRTDATCPAAKGIELPDVDAAA